MTRLNVGGWGGLGGAAWRPNVAAPFTRPAGAAGAASPAVPTPAADALGAATAVQARTPAGQALIDEIAARARTLRAERDRLEASLGQAAPHEWDGIYAQLRELDRDIASQDRLRMLAVQLGQTDADPGALRRFSAFALRAQRASTENQVKLEVQAEQLVREAMGLPAFPEQEAVYEALVGALAGATDRFADLKDALDRAETDDEREHLGRAIEALETRVARLAEAKDALDALAGSPAQTAARWRELAPLVAELVAPSGNDEQLLGRLNAVARADARPGESPEEARIYQMLGNQQGALNEQISALRDQLGSVSAGAIRRGLETRLEALERRFEALTTIERAVSRLEERDGGGADLWRQLSALVMRAGSADAAGLEALKRQVLSLTATRPD